MFWKTWFKRTQFVKPSRYQDVFDNLDQVNLQTVFSSDKSILKITVGKTNVIEYQKHDYETIEKDSLKVIGISDGDSFKVLFKNQELKIRIHGIDAPERNMPFYLTSKKYLSHLIFND